MAKWVQNNCFGQKATISSQSLSARCLGRVAEVCKACAPIRCVGTERLLFFYGVMAV